MVSLPPRRSACEKYHYHNHPCYFGHKVYLCMLTQYEPYFIKSVNYNPVPIGRSPGDRGWKDIEKGRIDNIFNDEKRRRRDFALLKEMDYNTIRIRKANSTFQKRRNRFTNRMTGKTLDIAEEFYSMINELAEAAHQMVATE